MRCWPYASTPLACMPNIANWPATWRHGGLTGGMGEGRRRRRRARSGPAAASQRLAAGPRTAHHRPPAGRRHMAGARALRGRSHIAGLWRAHAYRAGAASRLARHRLATGVRLAAARRRLRRANGRKRGVRHGPRRAASALGGCARLAAAEGHRRGAVARMAAARRAGAAPARGGPRHGAGPAIGGGAPRNGRRGGFGPRDWRRRAMLRGRSHIAGAAILRSQPYCGPAPGPCRQRRRGIGLAVGGRRGAGLRQGCAWRRFDDRLARRAPAARRPLAAGPRRGASALRGCARLAAACEGMAPAHGHSAGRHVGHRRRLSRWPRPRPGFGTGRAPRLAPRNGRPAASGPAAGGGALRTALPLALIDPCRRQAALPGAKSLMFGRC